MIRNLLVVLLFAFSTSAYSDEFICVPAKDAGFFTPTTNVLLWQNPGSKITVVHLPGGTGSFNVNSMWDREKVHGFGSILTTLLTDKNISTAYIDSPYSLGGFDLSLRRSEDHLERVASAIRVIHNKTHSPIWIFGHSNGSVSTTEIYDYLKRTSEENLLGGLILSSSRNELTVPTNANIPVLFIHHQEDNCRNTLYSVAQQHYLEFKSANKSQTLFTTVTSAYSQTNNGCFGGAHMYGNYQEIATIIKQFVTQ